MQPFLDAKIGYWQVASMPGKGQLACKRAMKRWVRKNGYHVKLDVRKCYPSITHDVVRAIVRKYIKSPDVIYCINVLLESYNGGLEIGSYFSLQMANLVLSFAYHYVESLHKTRRGTLVPLVTHQLWHMDDILLISPDKRNLKMATHLLTEYMRKVLGLTIKPWKVSKTSDKEPLDMGGFVVRRSRCTLRSAIFLRSMRAFTRFAKRRTLKLSSRACSYWGWLKHTDSDSLILCNGIVWLFNYAREIISCAERTKQWNTPKALLN